MTLMNPAMGDMACWVAFILRWDISTSRERIESKEDQAEGIKEKEIVEKIPTQNVIPQPDAQAKMHQTATYP